MAIYFICPACKQNNYGVSNPPTSLADFCQDLRCNRCGVTGIYWVKTQDDAKEVEEQLGINPNRIAVGVHDSDISYLAPDIFTRDQSILETLGSSATLAA